MPSAGNREEEIANLRAQAKAIGHILEHGSLSIQDFERLCPDVNRRSLQRDLKAMVDMRLSIWEGATNKLVYRMKKAG